MLVSRSRALVTRWWPCSADPDISVNSGRKARQVHCPSNNEIRSLSSSNYPHCHLFCAVHHRNQIKGIIKATYSNVRIGSRDKQPFTGVRERVLIGALDVDRRFYHSFILIIWLYLDIQGRSCFKNGREKYSASFIMISREVRSFKLICQQFSGRKLRVTFAQPKLSFVARCSTPNIWETLL